MAATITHSEQNDGWSSFWSYRPGWMARLNNSFYSFKNGQIYEHHDTENPLSNTFYGIQYNTSVKTVFNDIPANDKSFKTLILESSKKWDVQVATNYTSGNVSSEEFNTRESRQYTFIRQNENSADYHGGTAQGVGVIVSITPPDLVFSAVVEFVNVGDVLYQINNDTEERIGEVTLVSGTSISLDAFENTPIAGLYVLQKEPKSRRKRCARVLHGYKFNLCQ
jgi:hypothetical protein